jgi:PAS domain S-box-containing protein
MKTQDKLSLNMLNPSQEQLQYLLALSPAILYRCHASGDYGATFVSENVVQQFGYSPADFTTDPGFWRDRIHPEDQDRVFTELIHLFDNGHHSHEYRFRHQDGNYRWVRDDLRLIRDVAGNPLELVGSWLDITHQKELEIERQQTASALQQQVKLQQLVMDIAQRIRQSLELKEILQTTVTEVRRFLTVDRVLIFRFESDWRGKVAVESVAEGWTPILSTTIFDPCFRDNYVEPFRNGWVTAKPDIYKANISPCHLELLAQFQVRANLVVPILQGEDLWGLLIAHHCTEPREWQPIEIDLLQQLATQVGIAIRQSTLFKQVQIELNDRKAAEASLRESEERWQLAIAGCNDGIWDHVLKTNVLFVSEQAAAIAGIPEGVEPSLEEFMERIHPDDQQKFQQAIDAHLQQQTPLYVCELRIRHPDGKYHWVLFRAKASWDEAGNPIRITGSLVDIHDRKAAEAEIRALNADLEQRVVERTEQLTQANRDLANKILEQQQTETALRQTERRLRSFIDSVDLLVVGLEPTGQIEFVNPYFLKLTGYNQSEVLGKYWFTTFATVEESRELRDVFQEIVDQNAHPFYQTPLVTKAGEERMIAWNNTVLRNAKGEAIGTMSIGEDVTQRNAVERLKDEFISIVSHELRTPLTSIRGSLGLLATGVLNDSPEEMHRMIEIAALDTERLVRLVNDILDLEKLSSGKAPLVKEPCNVAELMQRSLAVMQAFAQESGVNLSMSAEPIEVHAAGDRIIQTLTNLLSNAIKFSPPNSEVYLTAALQDEAVLFKIQDQGRGIPSDMLETIFGRFQQVDASDSRLKGGTGLGLAICQSIVQQHGGKIWAESIVNQGSTFFFTCPLVPCQSSQLE